MLPFKTLIDVCKTCNTPVYLQIANCVILAIKKGYLQPAFKLPGSRQMAEILEVHRKTIVSAYQELYAQGWIDICPSKGTFVSTEIPETSPTDFVKDVKPHQYPHLTGFKIEPKKILQVPLIKGNNFLGFNDGSPDIRLAPLEELTKNYRNILHRATRKSLLSYGEVFGNDFLRQSMIKYLGDTRGLKLEKENIMITRGSQMAIYLVAEALINPGDKVLMGEVCYHVAGATFKNAGAELIKVPVDDWGINVNAIEEICKKQKIRLLYITPHHHYPTTVTLCAKRRVRLLQLAYQYGFAILEDDYDYDFHYDTTPILPLASADTEGMVIYIGSFCKAIAPAIRAGYVVAPTNLIQELGYMRRVIDRQGDMLMEQSLGELIEEGIIKRYLKKARKHYHERRNLFCELLDTYFKDVIHFEKPGGGLAVWAEFDKAVDLPKLSEKAIKYQFSLPNGIVHNTNNKSLNSARLGFASLDLEEIEKSIGVMRKFMP